MTETLIALGLGGAILLLDKHLPLLLASRRPERAPGLLERIFGRTPKTDP